MIAKQVKSEDMIEGRYYTFGFESVYQFRGDGLYYGEHGKQDLIPDGMHECCEHGKPLGECCVLISCDGVDRYRKKSDDNPKWLTEMLAVLHEHNITTGEQLRERLKDPSAGDDERWKRLLDRAEKAELELANMGKQLELARNHSMSSDELCAVLGHDWDPEQECCGRCEQQMPSDVAKLHQSLHREPLIACDHGWNGDDT